MDTLVAKVRKNVRSHGLIAKGDAVLVAVSGGVDSMVLLDVLRQLAEVDGFTIVVAHFNHQLRGRAADLDEKLVQQYCTRHELRFEAGRGEVKELAKEKKISIEMAARELRQAFFEKEVLRLKCNRLALAHHADDQAELFFIRLLRGSGGDGLSGMGWSGFLTTNIEFRRIRPLLNLRKMAIVAYAKRHRVKFREDASNHNTDILRNRIRRKLLPYLTKTFGVEVMAPILRTMEVVGSEADYAGHEACGWLEKLLGNRRRVAFEKLHPAIQRQAVLWQLRFSGAKESFDLIEALRKEPDVWIQVDAETFLRRQKSGQIEERAKPDASFRQTELECDVSGSSGKVLFASLTITWERDAGAQRFIKPKQIVNAEVFDAEKVGLVIRLRHWRAGDRFQPLGMPKPVKLQDWFVNRKVPMERRRQLVVAETADGRIFWVEGERIGEQFKLDKASRQRLKWQWQAEKPK
ncbi:MAG: cell cycle protein MesJ-like protein [Verrucomicrobia bacterium]|nr:cell cycle protein MesJ-like protein [Verrucomicrobiota bacterium]